MLISHFLSEELQADLSKLCFFSRHFRVFFEGDLLVLSSPVSCVAFQTGGNLFTWPVSDYPDILGSLAP